MSSSSKKNCSRRVLAHEECTSFLRNALPLLIDTGLRISEACALRWDHVGLEPRSGATLGWVYVEKGKSKYAKRHVPLTARARGILEKIKGKSKSKYVFPAKNNNNNEQLSRHWASEQFRVLPDAMKLPDDCVVHSTRHTFCTRLGESGVGAFEIQRLAGTAALLFLRNTYTRLPRCWKVRLGKWGRLTGKWCGAQDLNLHGLSATGS